MTKKTNRKLTLNKTTVSKLTGQAIFGGATRDCIVTGQFCASADYLTEMCDTCTCVTGGCPTGTGGGGSANCESAVCIPTAYCGG